MSSTTPPMRLHVPEPSGRPGCETDFSYLRIAPAGQVRRPPVDVIPGKTLGLAYTLIRVLDPEGRAVGPWVPEAGPERPRRGLRAMMRGRQLPVMYSYKRAGCFFSGASFSAPAPS